MQYYFDYAAATPLNDKVLRRMLPYFSDAFYNPSATYAPAKKVRHALYDARSTVARVLGVTSQEIIFTAGGTEANNLAVHGVLSAYPEAECVISAIEHDSVRETALATKRTRVASVDAVGSLALDSLQKSINDTTVLVSIMYANNEIGTIQNLKKISSVLQEIRHDRQKRGISLPLYFHTDACQAANYLSLDVHRLGVDLMTLNGGKIYGPKQSGCLFVRRGVVLRPHIFGGGQEYGLRSGTESVATAIGFATALERVQQMRLQEVARLRTLQQAVFKHVNNFSEAVRISGPQNRHRLPNNIHLLLPDTHNEVVLLQLEQQGILAAAGSACSAQKTNVYSHVLQALGVSEADARTSIRLTMGQSTDMAAVNHLISAVGNLISS